ncbi:MAG: phasin family protein, partial [Duganella sp.]
MSSLTEQFSAVTKSQLEAQFKIFNTFASTAVDSAEKVIALNLNTTKASVEKSSAAARKLLDAKDAQELFTLNAGQPSSFDHLLAYGRQLYNIATTAQTELLQSAQSGIKQAQELAKATPLLPLAKPLAAAPVPVAKPAPLASIAPVSAPPAPA